MKRRSFFAIALAPLFLKIRGLKAQSGPAVDNDAVAQNALAGDKQKFQLPFDPAERLIDSLGTASNIHSPADAQTYIEAILQRRYPTAYISPVPELQLLERRLALAEYAAITTDPTKRIPESRIADVFNRLMDEWGTPKWTRITAEDFHRFHKIKAVTLIPYSVSRDVEGNIAYTCRPVEAVCLFDLLSIERGLQSNYKALPDLPNARTKGPVYATGYSWVSANSPTKKELDNFRRYREYLNNRSAWLQKHPDHSQQFTRLFDALHI